MKGCAEKAFYDRKSLKGSFCIVCEGMDMRVILVFYSSCAVSSFIIFLLKDRKETTALVTALQHCIFLDRKSDRKEI